MPAPPVYATVKAVGVPPIQIDCVAVGCVEIVGSAFTITAAVAEVAIPQPEPLAVTRQ